MTKKHKKRSSLEDVSMGLVLLMSLFLRLGFYSMHSPLWDGSVYLLMGKHIFSRGAAGLWEPYRPLLWPAMLGFFWKLGGDPIFWGKALQIIFSLGSIYIVYLIGAQAFSKRAGLLAAAFLSFSPTYFTWANYLYTGIPSTFLGLLTVYFFFRNKDFSCGIFAGLAFLTRFLQVFIFIPLFLINLFRCKNKERRRGAAAFFLGFAAMFSIFLVLNLIMYKNAFFPFLTARKVLGAYSLLWYNGSLYYFKQFLSGENFCLLFYPAGVFFILRKNRDFKSLSILLVGLLFFLSINASRMQSPRYIISAMPYLYLVSAYGIFELYGLMAKRKAFARVLLSVLLIGLFVFECRQFAKISLPKKKLNAFQRYIKDNEGGIKGPVWISDPTTLVFSDLKASELIYYPVFNAERAGLLRQRLDEADLVLFNSGDFPCAPQGDEECLRQKGRFIAKIRTDLSQELYGSDPSGRIVAGIFKR